MTSAQQSGRTQGPNLTPSLANYFRSDLISHVTGWPAEILEKQVNNQIDKIIVIFLFLF